MKAKVQSALVLLCGVVLCGCASSGPKFSEMRASIPPVNPEEGRVFLYRSSGVGAAVQPEVKMNGTVIGKAVPKGFWYVDRAPGNYEISTSTEVKRTLSLMLEKGQTRFVRLGISVGFFVGHVYPELVEPAEAERQIANCHYLEAKKEANK